MDRMVEGEKQIEGENEKTGERRKAPSLVEVEVGLRGVAGREVCIAWRGGRRTVGILGERGQARGCLAGARGDVHADPGDILDTCGGGASEEG